MIVAVKEMSMNSSDSSIYLVDTEQIPQKDIAMALEGEPSIVLSYDEITENLHCAQVNPPILLHRIADVWF